MSDEESITVNRDMLKAIGADTRIDILKALSQRQKTQSELAEELKLSVPTVLEHLNHLEKVGLVQKKDEGRKWKYYFLTPVGKKMIGKSRLNVVIVLAISLMMVFGSLFLIYQGFTVQTSATSVSLVSNWVAPEQSSGVENISAQADEILAKNSITESKMAAVIKENRTVEDVATSEFQTAPKPKSFLPELAVLIVSLAVAIFSGWYLAKEN